MSYGILNLTATEFHRLLRYVEMSSARIDTVISDGPFAPIDKPTGTGADQSGSVRPFSSSLSRREFADLVPPNAPT